jgi:hypothetical protein
MIWLGRTHETAVTVYQYSKLLRDGGSHLPIRGKGGLYWL